jgi:hypothetical protein
MKPSRYVEIPRKDDEEPRCPPAIGAISENRRDFRSPQFSAAEATEDGR